MKKIATLSINDCVSCGCCEKACPKNAISVHQGVFAKVMHSQCIGCGLCAKACPADIISLKEAACIG